MKELSIEEKAKRYDEAIKRVEDIKTGKCKTTFMFTEGLFEHIFPELKESESIRLWLIDLLSTMQYHHCDEDMEMGNKAIAWLEKQGSQILANSEKTCKDEQKPAWSEEDEVMLENAISSINHESVIEGLKSRGISYSIDSSIHLMENLIDWLKSIKERYTWKPSYWQIECISDAIKHYNSLGYPATKLKELLDDLKKLREE